MHTNLQETLSLHFDWQLIVPMYNKKYFQKCHFVSLGLTSLEPAMELHVFAVGSKNELLEARKEAVQD